MINSTRAVVRIGRSFRGLWTSTIILCFFAFARPASSQSPITCGDPDSADREAILGLFRRLRDPAAQVPTTVADFTQLLPQGMRENYILMTESRSFQESSYEDPRVIMKSKNAGVFASFTGHGRGDGLRGTEKMEFIIWNGPQARYDFYEVDFPAEDPLRDPSTLTAAQRRPTVRQNPASCLNCHGGAVGTADTLDATGERRYITGDLGDRVLDSSNARPNWDTYNFWQGQLPFNRDTVFNGTEEARRYLDLLRKMDGEPREGQQRNPRLEALEPPMKWEKMEKTLREEGQFSISDYGDFDGPGVQTFDQSTNLNFCRVANSLRRLPFYDNIAPALNAATLECDMQSVLPAEATRVSDEYFRRRGISSYAALVEDTLQRQQSVAVDKEARQRQTFARLFRAEAPEISDAELNARIDAEMSKRMRENREETRNASEIARVRYLLEPLGVNVANWSLSIDSGTYSFADLLSLGDLLGTQGVYYGSPSCDGFRDQLRTTFLRPVAAGPSLQEQYRLSCESAEAPVTLDGFLSEVSAIGAAAVEENARPIFQSCNACHTGQGSSGAPRLPFGDMSALREEIRSTASMPNGGLGASILNRINKPEGEKGHMPMGPRSLTTQEKTYVRDFIGQIVGPQGTP